ncbi:unnamed protein product [Nezara viridula]|uniref:Uncharacterized protein n=1 Tax=Nezara viridula TaxID=85310 RepID=A0A9P0MQF0_NEZVI|nr:unnamed protein product [Nezara viridula]
MTLAPPAPARPAPTATPALSTDRTLAPALAATKGSTALKTSMNANKLLANSFRCLTYWGRSADFLHRRNYNSLLEAGPKRGQGIGVMSPSHRLLQVPGVEYYIFII